MSADQAGLTVDHGHCPDTAAASGQPPDIDWYFAMPMVRWRAPDPEALNEALRDLILARSDLGPEAHHSNVGGWQSRPDLLDGTEPCVVALRRHIVSLMRFVMAGPAGGDVSRIDGQLGVSGWANVNRHGDFNRVHDHPGSHWSGVY